MADAGGGFLRASVSSGWVWPFLRSWIVVSSRGWCLGEGTKNVWRVIGSESEEGNVRARARKRDSQILTLHLPVECTSE